MTSALSHSSIDVRLLSVVFSRLMGFIFSIHIYLHDVYVEYLLFALGEYILAGAVQLFMIRVNEIIIIYACIQNRTANKTIVSECSNVHLFKWQALDRVSIAQPQMYWYIYYYTIYYISKHIPWVVFGDTDYCIYTHRDIPGFLSLYCCITSCCNDNLNAQTLFLGI